MGRIEKRNILKVAALGLALTLVPVSDVSAMRIQHNVTALNSHRNLTETQGALSKNLEKISSGYRINRAGDDAAGLAISEQMRAQITGLEAVTKNKETGIEMIQTAEGTLAEVQTMLNRMAELALQAADGTNEADRAELQKEVDVLKDEIDKIAGSANFNGMKLLDGSQVVKTQENTMYLTAAEGKELSGVIVQGEQVTNINGDDTYELTIIGKTQDGTEYSEKLKISDMEAADSTFIFSAGDLENEGSAVFGLSDGENYVNAVVVVADEEGNLWVDNQMIFTEDQVIANMSFGTSVAQTDGTVEFIEEGTTLLLTYDKEDYSLQGVYGAVKVGDELRSLEDMFIMADGKMVGQLELDLDETRQLDAFLFVEDSENEIAASDNNAAEKTAAEQMIETVLGKAEETTTENETSNVFNVKSEALGISEINVTTAEDAQKAVKMVEEAIAKISLYRSNLGAVQNRLECMLNNLGVQNENMTDDESEAQDEYMAATASGIRGSYMAANEVVISNQYMAGAVSRSGDVDMSEEMMNYTKNNILVQASQSMLTQANMIPQGVLSLLQ